ncbi:hypothetical protein ACLI4Q_03705 [Natrialbaceae archaeon A-CW1-1]
MSIEFLGEPFLDRVDLFLHRSVGDVARPAKVVAGSLEVRWFGNHDVFVCAPVTQQVPAGERRFAA